jgi:hypothetical protein
MMSTTSEKVCQGKSESFRSWHTHILGRFPASGLSVCMDIVYSIFTPDLGLPNHLEWMDEVDSPCLLMQRLVLWQTVSAFSGNETVD